MPPTWGLHPTRKHSTGGVNSAAGAILYQGFCRGGDSSVKIAVIRTNQFHNGQYEISEIGIEVPRQLGFSEWPIRTNNFSISTVRFDRVRKSSSADIALGCAGHAAPLCAGGGRYHHDREYLGRAHTHTHTNVCEASWAGVL